MKTVMFGMCAFAFILSIWFSILSIERGTNQERASIQNLYMAEERQICDNGIESEGLIDDQTLPSIVRQSKQ